MAPSYSMFGFHFLLLSCFTLLVLVAPEQLAKQDHNECLKSQRCGYLGNIPFPFTTLAKPECELAGLPIRGCDNNHSAAKQIQLTKDQDQWYTIDSIVNFGDYHWIFVHYPDYDGVSSPLPPSQLQKPFNILSNITFSRCLRDHNDDGSSIPRDMSLYRHCPYYDIYFNSSSDALPLPMPALPSACFLFQFLPFAPIPFPFPTCPSSAFLFSFLQIQVVYDCKACPSQCKFKPKELIFTCDEHMGPKIRNSEGRNSETKKIIGLSVGIPSAVAVVAMVVILLLYKRRNKSSGLQNKSRSADSASFRNTTAPRESGAVYFGIPVFSYEELQEATNNFDQARELGEGGFGTVYYGKLKDGREVAVKRLFERNYRPVESFINEVQILTRMRHKNLVSLYGCTSRHSRELLLVYEYISNGTVSSHLHGDRAQPCSLPWLVRMKIAIQTARALAYLHASDIIHRDVKTSNILLDNDFGVKLSDFGLSRLFPDNVTHVSTAPQGTPGYVDPDYRLCYQLTTKSDVYSFGVVLIELMSSLKAIDVNRSRDDIKLANLAIRKIQKGAFCDLVDPFLGFQTDEKLKRMIDSVTELAFQCLQGDKELRPSMGEVLEVLQGIQSGFDESGNLEGIVVHGATRASQSYAHPPLSNTVMRPHSRLHQTH